MAELAIRAQGLTRSFETVRALDDLNVEVPAGSVFGFLGPNGAGKTTTIRLLLGLIEPTSGSAQVLGFDTRTQGAEIRARTGALLEHSGLYERLSAEDNLRFYGRVAHMPKAQLDQRIQELLTHLGLWERRKEAVVKWSRGMKQKLAIARPLLHRPGLVFLDEPTAGLDPVAAANLRDDLAALAARQGATIFLTTHNMAEAEKLCSLVAVIRQGKLLAVGSPADLRSRGGSQRTEITGRGFSDAMLAMLRQQADVSQALVESGRLVLVLKDGAGVAPLIGLIVREGGEVQEVRSGQGSLEDVFLMERSAGSTGSLRPLILIAVFGIFFPLRMGPERFFSAAGLLAPTFFSAIVITAVIADSFAGERERHTLETLLASRLSDRSILFGKIAACMAYGWLISISCILAGAITVNIMNWHGRILIFHDAASWLLLLLGPPLLGGVIATAGVLVSLHATTVRQAQQTLGVAFAVVLIGAIFGSSMLPTDWKAWFARILLTWSQADLVLAAAGVLLAIDLALLSAGMARFQRARLVLD
jgi:ABC-2 type transport system ATP-binding protein